MLVHRGGHAFAAARVNYGAAASIQTRVGDEAFADIT